MPTLRLDSTLHEYAFTEDEARSAKLLSDVQVKRFHTLYALTFKQRGSLPAPEDPSLDRSYFLNLAEIDGRLGIIQQILDDHGQALRELTELGKTPQTVVAVNPGDVAIGDVTKRAALLVNQP